MEERYDAGTPDVSTRASRVRKCSARIDTEMDSELFKLNLILYCIIGNTLAGVLLVIFIVVATVTA